MISSKLYPSYYNWLFLSQALLNIENRADDVLNFLEKKYNNLTVPYLTLTQIASNDNPNVLAWEVTNLFNITFSNFSFINLVFLKRVVQIG